MTMSDIEVVQFGPWLGSMRSVTPDQVPPEFITAINSSTPSNNFLYLPRSGTWKLRGGSAIKFESAFGASSVGLLPAKWAASPHASSGGSRIRHADEFLSPSISDGIPTVCALLSREDVPSALLDDGRWSQFYIRDQVNSQNYTVGEEYDQTYAAVGTTQTYRIIPLWYDSGDGGIVRGVTERLRRFFFCGSRRFLKVGNWWYFPSVLGTPSRWRGRFADSTVAGSQTLLAPSSTVEVSTITDEAGGAAVFGDITASDSAWIRLQNSAGGRSGTFGLSGTVSDNKIYTITYEAKIETNPAMPAASTYVQFELVCSGTERYVSAQIFPLASWTTSFATYTTTVTCNGTASPNGSFTANTIIVAENASSATNSWSSVGYVSVSLGDADAADNANYLFPTGPFPPTHAGTIAAGTLATGSNTVNLVPDADGSTDGSWTASTGSDLFEMVNDTVGTPNDSDYIQSAAGANHAIVRLSDPGFDVDSALYTVTLWNRVARTVAGIGTGLSVDIWEGDTGIEITTGNVAFATSFTTSFVNYSYRLTDAEVDAVTDWANLFIRYDMQGTGTFRISATWVEIAPLGDISGGWKGKDRFMKAVAYRFEDDSVHQFTKPRFPNATLSSGLDLVTVDSNNPEATYSYITWQNIPYPPPGYKSVLLGRTDKIDSTADDNLQIDPNKIKFVAEVPAGTTSYTDYKGDDAALVLDADEIVIRQDHMMAPRCRHIAGGDMRVATSYGGDSPVAFTIAPVGRLADYDLNTSDSTAATYGSGTADASYMRLALSTSGVMTLTLAIDNSGVVTTRTFTSDGSGDVASIGTLQALLDAINDTSFADTPNCGQWRAQLCGSASPDATMLNLTPHLREIANCTVSGQTITASSGLSKVAVGDYIGGTGVTAGAFVTQIDSDLQLTFSGTVTSGTKTLGFWKNLGDTVTGLVTVTNSAHSGWQRVIANSLPAFVYFNRTYLNTQTFDKGSTWMTVANPGSNKSAANCFSSRISNRFFPPLNAGIAQGVEAVDHGFVVLYANKVGAIRPRGPDSFLDSEYGLVVLDESRGCNAWNTSTAGNRFAAFMSAEGMFAADLLNVKLISSDIYTDMPTALGDFTYEGPQSVAAAARDTDGSYAFARVLRGILWVGYRTSASTTHPDRLVTLDFTSGDEATGLEALFRKPGQVWGWSVPLMGSSSGATAIYRYGVLFVGRRGGSSDEGFHIYGWNAENGGTTGDGRIDEIETGTTDPSSTAITGRVETPWTRPGGSDLISGQEIILEHSSPVSSTGSLVYHRTLSDDAYTLTPGTSSLTMYSEMKFLPQGARAAANAAYIDYRQATGSAREVRRMVLRYRRIRRFKT